MARRAARLGLQSASVWPGGAFDPCSKAVKALGVRLVRSTSGTGSWGWGPSMPPSPSKPWKKDGASSMTGLCSGRD